MAAIATNNGKLAIMELGQVWEPGLPFEDLADIDQDDQQQFLWGFPEILWQAAVVVATAARDALDIVYGMTIERMGI